MSMTVNTNPTMVSWEALLNQVNEASNAGKVSETNRSVTFTTQLDDGVASVIVNIPDDLELPSAVTPEAIETLMTKLGGADFNLNETQLALIKDEITKVYNQMAGALSSTQSKSTGAVMFDLYQLMALLVEVAQSQRNAARDLRNTQNQQIQNSIQSQADAQRNAAIVGLVVGVTCGVLSAAVSVGMLVGQGAAYKTQVNTARMSGMEAAQNKVTMLQNADTPQHAQAQLAKVEGGIKTEGLAAGVKDTINANTLEAKNQFEAAKTVDAKQTRFNEADARLTEAKQAETQAATTVETRKTELATAKEQLNAHVKAMNELGAGTPAPEISETKTATQARAEYVAACEAKNEVPSAGTLSKYDAVITAEGNLEAANTAKTQATDTVTQRTQEQTTAKTELDEAKNAAKAINAPEDLATARREYRAALELEADRYATEYENAVAQKAPKAEIKAARDKMHMARAYVNNELMKPDLKSTPTEYKEALGHAKMGADAAAQRLNNNMDYRGALRRIETLTGINAINTAIGNMLQSMTQSISGAISSEATRMGADQQKEQEQLDQTKDLFNQAQNVVNAAVQLMQAVRQAEAQSMRDAIQA